MPGYWKKKLAMSATTGRRHTYRKDKAASAIQALVRGVKSRRKPKGLNKTERKQVKNKILSGKETKYGRFYTYDVMTDYSGYDVEAIQSPVAYPGVQNPTDGPAACLMLQTGEYLSASSTALNADVVGTAVYVMGGNKMTQGDTRTTIDGNFAYCQSQKLSLKICMTPQRNSNQLSNATVPVHFRVIVFKARQHSQAQSPSLSSALYMNEQGAKVGITSSDLTMKEIYNDLQLNTNQFVKKREFRFSLINPVETDEASGVGPDLDGSQLINTNVRGPSLPYNKQLDFYLDRPKIKCKFNNATTIGINDHEVVNHDMTSYVLISAVRGFGRSYNGTQEARSWTVLASGTSKWRDC